MNRHKNLDYFYNSKKEASESIYLWAGKKVVISPQVIYSPRGCSKKMRLGINTIVIVRRVVSVYDYQDCRKWTLKIYVKDYLEMFTQRDLIVLNDNYIQKLLKI